MHRDLLAGQSAAWEYFRRVLGAFLPHSQLKLYLLRPLLLHLLF